MDNDKFDWKRFQRLRFDSKKITKHAKRAETVTAKHAHRFVIQKLDIIKDIRQHVTLWMTIVIVLIASVAVQMVVSQTSYTVNAPIDGGTYGEGMLGPIDTLNPLYATSSAELSATRLIFSSLYDYDQTGHLRADLATSINLDKSRKIYTVTLRQDAKWQDGEKLTAQDILYTVRVMKDPQARANAVLHDSWQDVRVLEVDDHTVKFVLPAAYASFPHALTFAVLPAHMLQNIPDGSLRESAFSISPVGSGPFSFRLLQTVDANTGQKVVHLLGFEDYYRGKPKLARIEIHAYNSSNAIAAAVSGREVNAALDVNDATRKLPNNFVTKAYPINNGVYALINTESLVMKDPKVRKALQLGTNTAAVRKVIGLSVPPLDLPFLPGQINDTTLPPKPAYDVSLAKGVLSGAGWNQVTGNQVRTKKKQELSLRLVAVKNTQNHAIITELSKQWTALGFKIDIVEFDPTMTNQSFAQSILQPRNYDVLINELAVGADPDVFAYWHSSQASSSGLNFSNYRNSVADDALLSARLRSEANLRDQKYRSFAQQWLTDVPAIGLYQSVMVYTHSPQSTALPENIILPNTASRYSTVLYWTADRGSVYRTP